MRSGFFLSLLMVTAIETGPASADGWAGTLVQQGKAYAVTADGRTAVGTMNRLDNDGYWHFHAFRWTTGTGLSDIGPAGLESSAYGISADGSVVVGQSNGHAFRWTQATGMVDLGLGIARAVSADGSVIVGQNAPNGHAFRWTQATGMVDLGTMGEGDSSDALGVSADGTVVVGYANYDKNYLNAYFRAFRWSGGGMTDIDTSGGHFSKAYGTSRDGSSVVGGFTAAANPFAPHYQAFRWTQAAGMVDLGILPGRTDPQDNHIGFTISADGNVVAGALTDNYGVGQDAFRWTSATGMQTVKDWLTAHAVDTGSASFGAAYGISADGSAIVGSWTGQNAFLAYVTDRVALAVVNAGNGGRVVSDPAGIDCGTACTANFVPDNAVTLTAIPGTGYIFGGWGGDCAGTTNTCTLTMNGTKKVTASFLSLAVMPSSPWRHALGY